PGGARVTLPPVVGATVTVYCARKVAVTLLFAFITTVVGFAVPVASPLQPANANPALGTAVSVTLVPEPYCPPGGLRVTLPPRTGVTPRPNALGTPAARPSAATTAQSTAPPKLPFTLTVAGAPSSRSASEAPATLPPLPA